MHHYALPDDRTVDFLGLAKFRAGEVCEPRADLIDASEQENIGQAQCCCDPHQGRNGTDGVDKVPDPSENAHSEDGVEDCTNKSIQWNHSIKKFFPSAVNGQNSLSETKF